MSRFVGADLIQIFLFGLGFETAKALLLQGATVILACRSVDKATEARSQLMILTHCPASAVRLVELSTVPSLCSPFAVIPCQVIVLKLDLCSFESVREFVKVCVALS